MRWLLAFLLVAAVSLAHAASVPPRDLNARAGYDQHIGGSIPMDTFVTDANGRARTLAAIAAGKPLLLAFGYYRCPNLCDLTLHGMGQAIARMGLDPARDFRVVFISIDPHEGRRDAHAAQAMLADMTTDAQAGNWTLATAQPVVVAALTARVGFRYFLDTASGQYVHPAGLVVITPAGSIAQYFFGVGYQPSALRLALIGASEGRLGTIIDRLVLLCCGFDPATGRYSVLISRLMIGLAAIFLALMAAGGWWLRRRTSR